MRIAILTYLYPEAVEYLYNLYPHLNQQSYDNQKKIIDEQISIWASGWEKAFKEQNIPVLAIATNIPLFLRKWAEENNYTFTDRKQIILEMLKKHSPDVLFYDLYDEELLKEIRTKINSIKLVALWKGSPPVDMKIFNFADVTISCAPEEVAHLSNLGLKAEHLHHAFNKNILNNNSKLNKQYDIIFIGQIFKAVGFHIVRDYLLKEVTKVLNVKIFSSAYELSYVDFLYHFLKKMVLTGLIPIYYAASNFNAKYQFLFEKSLHYSYMPFSLRLKKFLSPAVYGKQMYEIIEYSKVVLNIHADSSPLFASNMRLFETTGVGSCLLTDWKKNINELFTKDEEVITYNSKEELIEKAKWLLEHDDEREKIAAAGQRKVFAAHLYEHRLPRLLEIFNKHLK